MRLDRFQRLVKDEYMTIFVLGADKRSIPIGMSLHNSYLDCTLLITSIYINTVVSMFSTADELLDRLRSRKYLPSHQSSTSGVTSLYMHGRHLAIQGHETMASIGVGSLSHLLIRTRLIGGGTSYCGHRVYLY